jgi:hypothetical protein
MDAKERKRKEAGLESIELGSGYRHDGDEAVLSEPGRRGLSSFLCALYRC